jgi:hypothetical protein
MSLILFLAALAEAQGRGDAAVQYFCADLALRRSYRTWYIASGIVCRARSRRTNGDTRHAEPRTYASGVLVSPSYIFTIPFFWVLELHVVLKHR